jgi:hypothetical protein
MILMFVPTNLFLFLYSNENVYNVILQNETKTYQQW